MPNWCETTYIIEGKKETLSLIKDTIDGLLSGTYEPIKNSDNKWEGNILNVLGIPYNEARQHLRGFVNESPRYVDGTLVVNAEEAWSITDFRKLLRKAFPDIKIHWFADEYGLDYHKTNDADGKYLKTRFRVEICHNDTYYYEDCKTQKDMYKYISELLGINGQEEIDAYNELHEDDDNYIIIYRYDIINEKP